MESLSKMPRWTSEPGNSPQRKPLLAAIDCSCYLRLFCGSPAALLRLSCGSPALSCSAATEGRQSGPERKVLTRDML